MRLWWSLIRFGVLRNPHRVLPCAPKEPRNFFLLPLQTWAKCVRRGVSRRSSVLFLWICFFPDVRPILLRLSVSHLFFCPVSHLHQCTQAQHADGLPCHLCLGSKMESASVNTLAVNKPNFKAKQRAQSFWLLVCCMSPSFVNCVRALGAQTPASGF